MGLKRFSNAELTNVIKAAGTLQFDDDMLLDRTSQQLMLTVNKMSAEELYNLVGFHLLRYRMLDCCFASRSGMLRHCLMTESDTLQALCHLLQSCCAG